MQNINGAWLPTVTEDSILGFFGDYRFLSNSHSCPLMVDGVIYPSSEYAYMAMKVVAKEERLLIANIEKANKVKAYGRTVTLRANWEDIKVAMMYKVCYAKFTQNSSIRKALLLTGNKYLQETNYWGDRIWGVSQTGEGFMEGQNLLGKVIMAIREELRE